MFPPVAIALAIAAQSSAATEMLGMNVPDEFQVGNHAENGEADIVELVQPPETVDNWSRLISGLTFFNAAHTGLEDFYAIWRDQIRKICPGLTDTRVRGIVDGHAAIRSNLSCPRNPQTGMPENLAAFLIQGDANMMVAQVGFRRGLSPADKTLTELFAASLKICDQRTLFACSARRASGFVPSK